MADRLGEAFQFCFVVWGELRKNDRQLKSHFVIAPWAKYSLLLFSEVLYIIPIWKFTELL